MQQQQLNFKYRKKGISDLFSKVIYFEGNIGAGKTTLITNLKNTLQNMQVPCTIILEPVAQWKPLL